RASIWPGPCLLTTSTPSWSAGCRAHADSQELCYSDSIIIRMAATTIRKRLTREESRSQTRERLLRAAARVFLRRGFHRASVEEVAETAGFSTGAVYSNFSGKEELLLALCDERAREEEEAVVHIISGERTFPGRTDAEAESCSRFI